MSINVVKIILSLLLLSFAFAVFNEHSSVYSLLILLAITTSVLGDFALLIKQRYGLLSGMTAFGLSHLFYVAAFFQYPIDIVEWLVTLIFVSIVTFSVTVRLTSKLATSLRNSVFVYSGLLTLMFVSALSMRIENKLTLVALAATFFIVSDVLVAQRRLNNLDGISSSDENSFSKRVVGLVLYYAAQIIFVISMAMMRTDNRWLPV